VNAAQLMTRSLFVTGTDTGVGKTRIAAALCSALATRGHRVAAMKPVASGCVQTPDGLRNEDALALLSAMNVRARYSEVNPYAFEPAIAPHIAAEEAGTVIDFDVLDRAYERLRLQSDFLVVEGAGGWLAPLDARRGFADLAAHWRTDVILVVGLRLGCLNHALLTAESIERRGLALRGWIANSIDPGFLRLPENVASLRSRIRAPCLGFFPFEPLASLESVAGGLAVHALQGTAGI
jgi:dethiobiotin synthetase